MTFPIKVVSALTDRPPMPNGSSIAQRGHLPAPRTLRILLAVDDDVTARLVATEFLGDEMLHVTRWSPEQLLERDLTTTDHDLVLLGIGSVAGTLEQLRQMRTESPVVVIAAHDTIRDASGASASTERLTAAVTEPVIEALMEAGADDVIPPWSLGSGLLRRVVHHAIDRAEATRLRDEQSRLLVALASNSLDSVHVLNEHGVVVFKQRSSTAAAASSPNQSIGRSSMDFVHLDDRTRWQAAWSNVIAGGPSSTEELTVRLQTTSGYQWTELRLVNLLDHPVVRGIVVNGRDVTERRELERRLAHQATHDALTGLPNSELLRDRVDMALARSARHDRAVGVLFVDLDQFKFVNDSLGRDAGDELLRAVGCRMEEVARASDTVGRQGGDEFVVLVEDVDGIGEVFPIAERFSRALAEPLAINGQHLVTGASIGISMSIAGDKTAEAMLSEADAAMYQAKRAGRGRVEIFDNDLRERLLRDRRVEAELRDAIALGHLVLMYQPIIDVPTRTIRGCEALVRWQHPVDGLMTPDRFLPVAEETGLILELDRWVVEAACRENVRWETEHGIRVGISANISAASAVDPTFATYAKGVVAATGIDPKRLTLELTETGLLQHPDRAEATVRDLRLMGIAVDLDDFGTGFSSLAHLQSLPLTGLKIDRSFVAGLGRRASDTIIVRSTINLAADLDMTVTAEGVERVEQLAILESYGCDLVQGYYFDRPQTVEQLDARFANSDPRTIVWRSLLDDVGFGDGWR